MIPIIASVLVPLLLIITLPYLAEKDRKKTGAYRIYLFIACALYFVSWYLPSPLIDGRDTSFTTHFVGGGLFTGFLWLYVTKVYDMQRGWFLSGVSLFASVSMLGVLNELAELFLVRAGLLRLSLTDASWDLLANTLGALLFYVAFLGFMAAKKA